MSDYFITRAVVRGMETARVVYDATRDGDEVLGYIAGSYAAFMAGQLPSQNLKAFYNVVVPNDIDVFATTKDNAFKIVDRLVNAHIYRRGYTSSVHVYNLPAKKKGHMDVQVIEPKPEWCDGDFVCNVMNDFDLSCSRAVLLDEISVYCDRDSVCRWSKILRINDPMRTLKRVMKYHKRGVDFDDFELFKILRAWDAISDERKQEFYDRFEPQEVEVDGDYYDDWQDNDDWFEGE